MDPQRLRPDPSILPKIGEALAAMYRPANLQLGAIMAAMSRPVNPELGAIMTGISRPVNSKLGTIIAGISRPIDPKLGAVLAKVAKLTPPESLFGKGSTWATMALKAEQLSAFKFPRLDPAVFENFDAIVDFVHTESTQLKRQVERFTAVEAADRKMVEYFTKNPAEMKTMNRRLFEELIAEIWAGFGYDVELTKQTRDGGKDIVAVRKAHMNERLLIECKRPDPGNPVSVQLVRALYGVKCDDGATKAILATTSYFSPEAKQFFEKHKWELEGRDYDGILGWLKTNPKSGTIVLPD